jgi:hypothetical protein
LKKNCLRREAVPKRQILELQPWKIIAKKGKKRTGRGRTETLETSPKPG